MQRFARPHQLTGFLFDVTVAQNLNEVDWSKYWNPRLYVDNAVGQLKETVWNTVMFNANMEAYVFERRRVAGTFIENLELYQFPFDTQVTRTTLSYLSLYDHKVIVCHQ